MFVFYRHNLQPQHKQQWRMAAEEPGRFLWPPLLPGHPEAQCQLFSGTPQLLLCPLLLMFVFFLSHVPSYVVLNIFVCVHMQMEALPQLTVRQIAEIASIPGQLTSAAQVNRVMEHIPNQHLSAFFTDFSPAVEVSFCIRKRVFKKID